MAASPGGQALDAFLREQFDVLQVLRDNMDAILRVANHLTPVEDLQILKDEIDAIYPRLGALVEASDLILSASEAGIVLLQAIDAPAQRAALQLGSAALRSEESLADASALANTNTTLSTLADYVDTLAANLLLKASQTALDAQAHRMDVLEDGLVAQITSLINAIWESDYLTQVNAKVAVAQGQIVNLTNSLAFQTNRITGLSDSLPGLLAQAQTNTLAIVDTKISLVQAQVTSTSNSLSDQIVRIDELLIQSNAAAGTNATQNTKIQNLTSRVVSLENWKALTDISLSGLQAQITTIGDALDSQGTAIDGVTGQAANAASQAALANALAEGVQLRVDAAEALLAAQQMAANELVERVDANEAQITYFNGRIGSLVDGITSNGNLLWNAGLESNTNNWTLFSVGADWDAAVLDRAEVTDMGLKALHVFNDNDATVPTTDTGVCSANVEALASQSYIVSGYIGAVNCTARLEYRLLNSLLEVIGYGLVGMTQAAPAAALKDWERKFSKLLIPDEARFLQVQLWATSPTGAQPEAFLLRPMVEQARGEQTQPSPWVASAGGLSSDITDAADGLADDLAQQAADLAAEILERINNDAATLAESNLALANKAAELSQAMADNAQEAADNLAAESSARADAILAEQTARLDALTTERSERIAAIQAVADDLVTETGERVAAIQDLIDTTTGLQELVDSVNARIADITEADEYSDLLAYPKNEMVTQGGYLYIALQDVPAGTALTNTAYWKKLGNYTSINGALSAMASQLSIHSDAITDINGELVVVNQQLDLLTANVGDNTAAISSEQTLRATADNALGIRIDAVVASSGDNAAAITAEQTARSDADTALGQRIDSVVTSVGDNTAAITSEATARTDQGTALGLRIDNVIADVADNLAAITNEQTARADADTALGSRIDEVITDVDGNTAAISTEVTARSTADTALGQRIDAVVVDVGDNLTAITNETTARVDGDSALGLRIDAVVATAGNNTAAILAEQLARSDGDSALAVKSDTLSTKILGTTDPASVTLATLATGLLAEERTARSTADSSQVTATNALQARMTDAEADILTTQQAIVNGDNALSSEIDTLKATVNNPTTGVAATASGLSGLTTRVGNNEDAISTQALQITNLEGVVNDPVTGVAATSTALGSLETRVTSAEGTLTSQGNSITSLNSSITNKDFLSGNGTNLLWAEYTRFTNTTLPPNNKSVVTLACVALAGSAGGYVLQGTTGGTSITADWAYLGTSATDYNLPLPAGKYIVSFEAKANVAGHKILFQLKGSNGAFYSLTGGDITLSAAMTRYSGAITLPAGITAAEVLIYFNRSGVSGRIVQFDRLMIESQVGSGTTPSTWVPGPTNRQTDTANTTLATKADASAVTALTTRVTAAEGVNTSQSTQLTTLQNTVNDPTTGVVATASGLSSLITTVGSQGDTVTSHSAAITSLQNELHNPTTGLAATASALDALTSTVTSQGGSITAVTDRTTVLETTVNTSHANALADLGTRITATEDSIDAQASDIVSLGASVDALEGAVAGHGTALTNLSTRTTTAEGTIVSQGTAITNLQNQVGGIEDDVTANAGAISSLNTTVSQNGSTLTAMGNDVTAIQAGLGAILGSELIPNWNFADGITGTLVSGVTRTADNGELHVVATDASENRVEWLINDLEIGATYRFATRAKLGAQGNTATIKSFTGTSIAAVPITSTSYADYSFPLVATATTIRIRIYANQAGATGDDIYIDWASLKKVTNTSTANAVNALDVRVQQTEDGISAAAADITTLELAVFDPATGVAATASSLDSLTSRVTTAEGSITSLGSRTTALENTVNNATTGVAASASAIGALTTRVTTAEDKVTTNTSDITTLKNTVNNATTGVVATANAVSTLDAELSSLGDDVSSLSGAVTTLQNQVNNPTTGLAAVASGVSSLTTRVTTNEDNISTVTTDVTALKNTVNNPTTGVAASASAITGLSGRITATEDDVDVLTDAITDLLISVNDPETGLGATAGGLVGLNTQVTTLDGTVTTLSNNVTSLQNAISDPSTGLAANSSAINSLASRVTSAEGVNTSQGTAITTLQNAVNDGSTGLATKASTTITNALDGRVTAAENSITAQGSAITTINSRLDNGTTGLDAKASVTALNSLTTRVTAAEGTIVSQGNSLTALTNTVAGKATTTALNALDTRVTSSEGSITALSNSMTALQSSLNGTNGTVAANSSAITALQTSVSGKNKVFYQAAAPTSGMITGDQWIDSDDSNRLYVYSGAAWVDASASGVKVFFQPDAPSSVGRTVGDLWIESDNNNKVWRWSGSGWVDTTDPRIAASATAITALESTVNNPVTGVAVTASAVQTLATRVSVTEDGLEVVQASYALALNAGGKVAGLYAMNDGTVSALTFDFDSVAFVNASGSSSLNGGILVQRAGGYMSVSGPGFGANGDLMRWYGPDMAVTSCTKANALSYEDTSGHVYVPSLTVGDISYFNSSTSGASPLTISITASDTNGDTKVITATYNYGFLRNSPTSAVPSGSATLSLWRKIGSGSFVQLGATQNLTFTGQSTNMGDGTYDQSLEGSLTFTYYDTDPTLDVHTYEWRLTSRTNSIGGSYGTQQMTLKSLES